MNSKSKKELLKTVVVTESRRDAMLLKAILGQSLSGQYSILAGEGIVNAISIAHVLRNDHRYFGKRVVLVIDGDKDGRNAEYARLILGQGKEDKTFQLVVNDPEIESLFFDFQDKKILEAALGGTIDPIVWELAHSSPKKALDLLLKEHNKTMEDLLSVPSFLELLRKSPKIQKIIDFIRAAEEAVH